MHSEKKSKKVLPKVLNIGGPSGLSRLDLTKVLGKATQTNLVIHENEKEHTDEGKEVANGGDNTWKIYLMKQSSNENDKGPQSPQDITMMSTRTEQYCQFDFSDINADLIEQCLNVI